MTYRRISTIPPKILSLKSSNAFNFGDGDAATPVLRDVSWTINDGESWAVVGSSYKDAVINLLTGHLRISPSPPVGLYPFLSQLDPPSDSHDSVALVSFATRLKAAGGAFYDFSARYGALRDEERITLRESLYASASIQDREGKNILQELAERLDLTRLLDLPLVALSNGQTRRARILSGLLKRLPVLILDEPFTGLDVQNRPRLSNLLKDMHEARNPRVIIALRPQDPIPDWISHIAVALQSTIVTGERSAAGVEEALHKLLSAPKHHRTEGSVPSNEASFRRASPQKKDVIVMKGVNVSYSTRHILKDVNWTIREGDRWQLQGANGSGKTTLTSLLTGAHPQSYIQSHLHIFSQPRSDIATVTLQQLIGHVSPELFNAFPRRLSGPGALTVKEAIASGFDGNYVYRRRTQAEDERIGEMVDKLGPGAETGNDKDNEIWLDRAFATLPPGEQSLALLIRALVNRPKLIILDEVFAGMDDAMVLRTRQYLREDLGDDQAVVFVGHWESEVPWSIGEGLRVMKMEDGHAFEVD
ncbi:P-loop containing nucleoside triphosphate hydrolase protein [Sistotremastrum suecicum HHB10207 ss-3]|uniref:p-loop containing nucleoside triphosphate hydrolase protein n=1 Tax=Sistotremastrum suecicum HHB10207 ss-3 TaxID=1314776 RepID=A0A166CBQ5_9AGAM|nr:P-loop containing nucleoside triphosphate hydrolase protein [Sistotremastrum suecicum HHB10207 ss-3]